MTPPYPFSLQHPKTNEPLNEFTFNLCSYSQRGRRKEFHFQPKNKDQYVTQNEVLDQGRKPISANDFKFFVEDCRNRYPYNVKTDDPIWAYQRYDNSYMYDFHTPSISPNVRHFIVISSLGEGIEGHSAMIWVKVEAGKKPVIENAFGYYSMNDEVGEIASFGPKRDNISDETMQKYLKGIHARVGTIPNHIAQMFLGHYTGKKYIRLDPNVYKKTLQTAQNHQTKYPNFKLLPAENPWRRIKGSFKYFDQLSAFSPLINQSSNSTISVYPLIDQIERIVIEESKSPKKSQAVTEVRRLSLSKRLAYPLDYTLIPRKDWSDYERVDFGLSINYMLENIFTKIPGISFPDPLTQNPFTSKNLGLSPGDHYEGSKKNGEPHGQGKIVFKTPIPQSDYMIYAYEGQFVEGEPHGKGIIYLEPIRNPKEDTPQIEAQFFRGYAHGPGIMYDRGRVKRKEGHFEYGDFRQGTLFFRGEKPLRTGFFNKGSKAPGPLTIYDYDDNFHLRGESSGRILPNGQYEEKTYAYRTRAVRHPDGSELTIFGDRALYKFPSGHHIVGRYGIYRRDKALVSNPETERSQLGRPLGAKNEEENFFGQCAYVYPNGNILYAEFDPYGNKFKPGPAIFILSEKGYLNTGQKQNVTIDADGNFSFDRVTLEKKKMNAFEKLSFSVYKRLKKAEEIVERIGDSPDIFTFAARIVFGHMELAKLVLNSTIGKAVDEANRYIEKNPEAGILLSVIFMAKQSHEYTYPLAILPEPKSPSSKKTPQRHPAGRVTVPSRPILSPSTSSSGSRGNQIIKSINFYAAVLQLEKAAELSQENQRQLQEAIGVISARLKPGQSLKYNIYYNNGRFSHLGPKHIPHHAISKDGKYAGSITIYPGQRQLQNFLGNQNYTPQDKIQVLEQLRNEPGVDKALIEAELKKLRP